MSRVLLSAVRLNGSENERIGLAKSLAVMTGDTVRAEVYAKYLDPDPSNWTAALQNLMAAIAGGTAPTGTVIEAVPPVGSEGFPFAGLLDAAKAGDNGTRAYLNILVFDENLTFVDGAFVPVTTAAMENGTNVPHEKLALEIIVQQPGYVYIYLSNDNEQPLEVFFDDFTAEHAHSAIVQADDYYPFGMTFNEYRREDGMMNKYLYNGKEIQQETGWYHYGARFYMPDLGRWMVPDPVADAYVSYSPYNYVLGNPISNVDQEGMWTVSRHHKMTLKALSAVGIGGEQAELIAHYASVYADNPGDHIHANNAVHPGNMMSYRDDIDYSPTKNSQVTDWNGTGYNYNIWHSMRSEFEKNAWDNGEELGKSAHEARLRGLEFGWGQIFESASSGKKLGELEKNSSEIQGLGQGLHALQDSYAHKGRHDVGASHIANDIFGDTGNASRITGSAITVYKLLTNDFDGIKTNKKGGFSLDVSGMSADQKAQVLQKAREYLDRKKEDEK